MMKQVSLIWSLLVILIIFLESMNTASALKCYECGSRNKSAAGYSPCKKGAAGDLIECPKGEDGYCIKTSDGDIVIARHCAATHPSYKDGCIEAGPDLRYGNNNLTLCFCSKDGCNGDSPEGNGAIPLDQMSLWLFFTLSIMVPWVSRALFAD